jgi:hypothetical protein
MKKFVSTILAVAFVASPVYAVEPVSTTTAVVATTTAAVTPVVSTVGLIGLNTVALTVGGLVAVGALATAAGNTTTTNHH